MGMTERGAGMTDKGDKMGTIQTSVQRIGAGCKCKINTINNHPHLSPSPSKEEEIEKKMGSINRIPTFIYYFCLMMTDETPVLLI